MSRPPDDRRRRSARITNRIAMRVVAATRALDEKINSGDQRRQQYSFDYTDAGFHS